MTQRTISQTAARMPACGNRSPAEAGLHKILPVLPARILPTGPPDSFSAPRKTGKTVPETGREAIG